VRNGVRVDLILAFSNSRGERTLAALVVSRHQQDILRLAIWATHNPFELVRAFNGDIPESR
jgi:hypothetical protein